MCGIAGYLAPDEGASPDLAAMIATLGHRGPDRSAMERLGPVGMAAARLAIVGQEAGAQPRVSAQRSLLVLNGEIFNWRDLDDFDQDPESDTAALHDVLDREGSEVLQRVRGSYALAWSPGRNRLLLARDPFGQRPLYYGRLGDTVIFASELKALAAAGHPLEIDETVLASLLRFQFLPPGKSLIRGIRSLRAGEVLQIRMNKGKPVFTSFDLELREMHQGAGESELQELLVESAWLQRARDQKSGILLSGGLDSSAILGLLSAEGGRPDQAYVGYFPEGPASFDERAFARIAAEANATPLVELPISAADFAAAMPRTMRALEEPVAGPGAVSQFLLCERAAQDVKVLFSGQGGDELFGGYERLRILAALEEGATSSADPAYAGLFARMKAAREAHPDDPIAAYRAALDRGQGLANSGNERARSLLARAGEMETLLGESARQALDFATSFEWSVLLPGLLQVDDRLTANFGMEGRAPFLDPFLATELLAIPLRQKSPPEEPRALFRRLLAPHLPEPILARREKLGFPVPLKPWWRGPLNDFARQNLEAAAQASRGFLEEAAIPALLDDDGAGGRLIYFLLMLEFWMRDLEEARSGSKTSTEEGSR